LRAHNIKYEACKTVLQRIVQQIRLKIIESRPVLRKNGAMFTMLNKKLDSYSKGLTILLWVEFFERFAYFGLRALLILYMVSHLHDNDSFSFSVSSAFVAIAYATSIMGGAIADNIFGKKYVMIWGIFVMTIGYALICFPQQSLMFMGLSFIALGSGLFKPNMTALLGSLYDKTTAIQRESGFLAFYVPINVASFLSSMVCGWIAKTHGWHLGFFLTFLSSGIGFFVLKKNDGLFKDDLQSMTIKIPFLKNKFIIALATIVGVSAIRLLLSSPSHIHDIIFALGGIILCAFSYQLYNKAPLIERRSLIAILILLFFSTPFFALSEQSYSSLNLFIERNVNHNILGFELHTSQFLAISPLFIFCLAIIFAKFWRNRGKDYKEYLPPAKFTIGLFLMAVSFGCLSGVIHFVASPNELLAPGWLLLIFFLLAAAELFISPIGLSAVTKLAPKHNVSTIMSFWYLAIAIGSYLSGHLAKLSSVHTAQASQPSTILSIYESAFLIMGLIALALAMILCFSQRYTNALFRETKNQ